MRCAYVTTSLLDMLAEPRFDSERVNQLLFGDIVTTGALRKGHVRVTKSDGYKGWSDKRFLKAVSGTQATEHIRNLNWVVGVKTARLADSHFRTQPPHLILYGALLRGRSPRAGWVQVLLPDASTCFIKASSLRPINRGGKEKIDARRLIREATRFLGVPYLWGGISSFGFDCSGLVQTICRRFAMDMPRDTQQQARIGRPVERSAIRAGDLLFFNRHVGLAIDRDRIIHASLGGGGVRINSLTPDGEDYRPDLDRSFRQARRFL